MAYQDNHLDPWQALRDMQRRIELLERSDGLVNASISSGGIRILTTSGNEPVAGIGHFEGKSGVIIPGTDGGWMTVQEWVDARIAASGAEVNARTADLDESASASAPPATLERTKPPAPDGHGGWPNG